MSTWNKRNFSIYTSDERSALGLIEELGKQTNYNTEEVEKVKESDSKKVSHSEMSEVYKLSNQGDFTGSWFGLPKPTLSEEGMRSQVEQNTKVITMLQGKSIKTFEDFGAKGDFITDDTDAFIKGCKWSKENNSTIYLLDKIYRITSVDVGGAIIRSLSGTPGGANPYFLYKRNGSPALGSPNWNYYFNEGLEDYTWENMINDTGYGPAIVSNYDGPILRVTDGEHFDVDGFAVIGNHRLKNQDGLFAPKPESYRGTSQRIKNIRVVGCGRHGINLIRGLECSNLERVACEFNNGHGLYTGQTPGIDSATEYITFRECTFSYNRLNGVHFEMWRKHINFYNCDLGGNGQYHKNAIDPLLGYDRRPPNDQELMHSGVWVNNGNVEANGTSFNFTMINCWGEMIAKLLHLRNVYQNGVANSVVLQNNTFFRDTSLPSNGVNGVMFYFDVSYASNWYISGNYNHALDMFKFKRIPTNGGEIHISDYGLSEDVLNSSFNVIKSNSGIETKGDIKSDKRIYGTQVLVKDIEGDGTTLSINNIKSEFYTSIGQLKSNKVAVFLITASWQATNSDQFGGYLLFVTMLPGDKYKMLTIPLSSVNGFTNAPSLSSTGILSIESQQYYRYTLTRLDIQKTI